MKRTAIIDKITSNTYNREPFTIRAFRSAPGAIAQAIANLATPPAAPASSIHHKRHAPDVAAALADINTLREDGAAPDLLTVLDSLEAVIVQTGDPGSFARWVKDQKTPNGPAIVTEPGTDRTLIEAEVFVSEADVPRPVLAVFGGEVGNGVELDVAGADRLIADFEVFVPRLRVLRDQLAESTIPADMIGALVDQAHAQSAPGTHPRDGAEALHRAIDRASARHLAEVGEHPLDKAYSSEAFSTARFAMAEALRSSTDRQGTVRALRTALELAIAEAGR